MDVSFLGTLRWARIMHDALVRGALPCGRVSLRSMCPSLHVSFISMTIILDHISFFLLSLPLWKAPLL